MSRIGNKPITVPDGVEVKIDGHKVTGCEYPNVRFKSFPCF